MSNYYPDKWAIVEINTPTDGKYYKILASWYGGFSGSNTWKLSSGFDGTPTCTDGVWDIPQSSGSVYSVRENENSYGTSMLALNVYNNWFESLPKDTIMLLSRDDAIELLKNYVAPIPKI